jgi:HEPN domain-containing protein
MPPESPDPNTQQEAREWLARAERDLQAARNEVNAAFPLPEMTAYHAQQAVEKGFKAFLTASCVPFRYTHDLVELQAQCEAIDPNFGQFLPAAQMLTPYATQFRYPGGQLAPPLEEAQQAIELAAAIVSFVQQQL